MASDPEAFRKMYGAVGYNMGGLGRPRQGPGFLGEDTTAPTNGSPNTSPGPRDTPGPSRNYGRSTPSFGQPISRTNQTNGNVPPLTTPGVDDNKGFNLNVGDIASAAPVGPSSPFQQGRPAPPASAVFPTMGGDLPQNSGAPASPYVRGNPAPPAENPYTPPPSVPQQLSRLAAGAVGQYRMSKVPGTPQAQVVEGAKSFGRWGVTPSPYNLDTKMQRHWSSESKNLVYGRGISEPSPLDIETDKTIFPSKGRPESIHSDPHPPTGHGVHIHDETAFSPLRGPTTNGAPGMMAAPYAGPSSGPGGPLTNGASRPQHPDLMFEANRAGVGANPWFNQHDQVVSGLNVQPVQSIGAKLTQE